MHSKKGAVRKVNWLILQDSKVKHELSSVMFWSMPYNAQSVNEEFSFLRPNLHDGILNCFGLMNALPAQLGQTLKSATVLCWIGKLAMGSWKEVFCAVLWLTQNPETCKAIYCNEDMLKYQQLFRVKQFKSHLQSGALRNCSETLAVGLFQALKASHISTQSSALQPY